MSRSCHSATSSSAANAFPRSTRARPTTCSDLIGLRLWGIELEPFWPRAERLLAPRHLGPGEVAHLGREALDACAGQRDRLSSSAWRSRGTTWVETGSRASPSRASTRSSNSGEVAEYVPTAPEIAPTATWSNARVRRSAFRCASNAKPASLIPNVVGSAWMPWVRPTHSVWTCSRAALASASTAAARPAGRARRPRRSCSAEPGVEHVARGQAVVDPAAGRRPRRPARRRTRPCRGR